MKYRKFAGTAVQVSEVGLGCWQIGGTEWGDVTDAQALDTLQTAIDSGITFLDTADIYGQGRSERLIAQYLRGGGKRDQLFIATKLGRRSDPGWPENFSAKWVRQHTEDSLERLGTDRLDLTQTHCLPLDELRSHDTFGTLATLQQEGKIRGFGASVETIDEALQCLQVPGLSSLQIIFNIFRQRPIDELFAQAAAKNVAIIVRLPLASGLLSGKMSATTPFAATDHRVFNRNGEKFNVGETFAGVPFESGLAVVEQMRKWVPNGQSMAAWALRWCLDFPQVTVVIPGAKHAAQVQSNASASELPPIAPEVHHQLRELYRIQVAPMVRGRV